MIAVCIPTYNQSAYVASAVESCLSQVGVEVKVIVSDDASTDNTAAMMLRFAGDPRVVYHRQPENRGIAANAGWVIAQADTEFVVRLDSDDRLAPEYCATLAQALRENPSAGVAHASVSEIDQHDQYRRMRILYRARGLQSPDIAIKDAIKGYRVAANICMFRRAALPAGGVYRSGMNFGEDWDLFVRLAAEGWGNVYIDKVLASYRVWSDPGGYRRARKLSEINGIRRVFEESLAPAFVKRGWAVGCLYEARCRFALAHAKTLLEVHLDKQSREELIEALESLGASSRLKAVLWLSKNRVLSAGYVKYANAKIKARELIKFSLSKI